MSSSGPVSLARMARMFSLRFSRVSLSVISTHEIFDSLLINIALLINT